MLADFALFSEEHHAVFMYDYKISDAETLPSKNPYIFLIQIAVRNISPLPSPTPSENTLRHEILRHLNFTNFPIFKKSNVELQAGVHLNVVIRRNKSEDLMTFYNRNLKLKLLGGHSDRRPLPTWGVLAVESTD